MGFGLESQEFRRKKVFASKWGRKIFVWSTFFSWLWMVQPWLSTNDYNWLIYFMVQVVCSIVLCYSKPIKNVWKMFFSVFAEILLISVPIIYFWPMALWCYLILTHENVVTSGQILSVSPLRVVLAFIPILAFPVLRRVKKDETK